MVGAEGAGGEIHRMRCLLGQRMRLLGSSLTAELFFFNLV